MSHGLTGILEVISAVSVFVVMAWAVIINTKKPKIKTREEVNERPAGNVHSIHEGRNSALMENLQLFLEAEDHLAVDNHEEYMKAINKALHMARKNIEKKKVNRAG